MFHVAFFDEGGFKVVDVWESPEHFQAFVDNRLMPGVAQVGIEGEPNVTITPAHAVWNSAVGLADGQVRRSAGARRGRPCRAPSARSSHGLLFPLAVARALERTETLRPANFPRQRKAQSDGSRDAGAIVREGRKPEIYAEMRSAVRNAG